MHKLLHKSALVLLLCIIALTTLADVILPPPTRKLQNQVSAQWYINTTKEKFTAYSPTQHTHVKLLHQWVLVNAHRSFKYIVVCPKHTSVYLNNRLVFYFDFAGKKTLNLTDYLTKPADSISECLLSIQFPLGVPKQSSFTNYISEVKQPKNAELKIGSEKNNNTAYQSTYLILLLGIGLFYGVLKQQYPKDWSTIFNIMPSNKATIVEEALTRKPPSTLPNLLFLLAFSLSLALATTAITNQLQATLLIHKSILPAYNGVVSSVLLGAVVVFILMLSKFLYLTFFAYLFDFGPLPSVQYKAFVFSALVFGMLLPFLLLLYFAVGSEGQLQIASIANVVLMLLIAVPGLRVFYILWRNGGFPPFQLFCYLCITEILPLAIILKIVFLSY